MGRVGKGWIDGYLLIPVAKIAPIVRVSNGGEEVVILPGDVA